MTKPGSSPRFHLHTHEELDLPLQAGLLALFGAWGATGRYWSRVWEPATQRPPVLITLATSVPWPPKSLTPDAVLGAVLARPSDRSTAELDALVLHPSHHGDAGVAAGLLATTLHALVERRMQDLRYVIPGDASYLRRKLTDAGLVPEPELGRQGEQVMRGALKDIITRLDVSRVDPGRFADPGFGASADDDAIIQLASVGRWIGRAGGLGIVVNPDWVFSPDGGPPDAGPPEPGVPPAPAPEPPPGPDPGSIIGGWGNFGLPV